MKFIILTDLHKYGPYRDRTQKIPLEYGKNVIYLGDNWDVNCRYADRHEVKFEIKSHKILCSSTETANVCSNHEGVYSLTLPVSKIVSGVCFTHGHYMDYSPRNVAKWEIRRAGISNFKFNFLFLANLFLKRIEMVKIPYKSIVEYAKLSAVDTIVCGHFHRNTDKVVDGIRVITLDRGRHILEIP